MEAIDEILEFLHYHPQAKRVDVENCLSKKSSSATIKRILAKGVSDGYIAVEGVGKATVYSITPKAHLLRTVDLDSYYAEIQGIDPKKSENLIAASCCFCG